MKVVLITNIPNPYRIPLFNELDQRLKESGSELHVVFGSTGYKRRQWKTDFSSMHFPHHFLKSWKIRLGSLEKYLFTYNGLNSTLRKINADVIITNGFSIATLKVWVGSFFHHKKYMIWTGSVHTKGRKDGFLRRIYRRVLASRAEGFIAYSTLTSLYLQQLGVRKEKITLAINTTDTLFYGQQTDIVRSTMVRDDSIHFLYVGHLTPGKRIDLALKALSELKKKHEHFYFDIVGDGTEKDHLVEMAEQMGLNEKVRFHGFVQKDSLPNFLAQADIFLFPSEYDVWGLVVVEAMSAGLPCLSSLHSGVTLDLIKDGETGYAVDFEKTDSVIDRMMKLINDPSLRYKMGNSARAFIEENVTIRKSVSGFIEAIGKMNDRPGKTGTK